MVRSFLRKSKNCGKSEDTARSIRNRHRLRNLSYNKRFRVPDPSRTRQIMAANEGQGASILKVEPEVGVKVYEWRFDVPPRTMIIRRLELEHWNAMGYIPFVKWLENPNDLGSMIPSIQDVGYTFRDLKFTTGVLGTISHSWDFGISKQFSVAGLIWIKFTGEYGILVRGSELHTFQGERLKTKLKLESEQCPRYGYRGWLMKSKDSIPESVWDDSVDTVKVILKVQCEPKAKFINLTPSGSVSSDIPAVNPLELKSKDFYLSDHLSDVVLVSGPGGQEFPAHRFLLACKSPVFHRMFQNPMKETLEGRVVIDDMKPEVLKEMLYFLYTGEFTGEIVLKDASVCTELLKSADKYGIEALKMKCAEEIARQMTFDNALEVYVLGDTLDENLMERALEVMKRNKVQFLKDPETLLELANRYPDLLFELATTS